MKHEHTRMHTSRRRRSNFERVVLFVGTLVVLTGGFTFGQEDQMEWQQRAARVTQLTRTVTYNDGPYVNTSSVYDPDRRVILPTGADFEFPVTMTDREWLAQLGPDRYHVLREDATERAFRNELYDNHERGIYYSAATGQPLFSSEDKYDSGTGWPSFTRPITPDAVAYMWDNGLFSRRIEVVDSLSGSHLGHVFSDGPAPTGQRYCMNSAALIFVPEGGDPPAFVGE
jgi:peptide-methionine (R)-S-oxide reductase